MSRQHDTMIENDETYPKKHSGGSRGFFAMLMLCLIAVGGVALTTFSDSHEEPVLESEADPTSSPTTLLTTTTAKPVAVTPATTTTVSTTTTEQTTTTAASSLFVLPLSNKVLRPYSEQPVYNEVLNSYHVHTAVDFDGEEGQSIHPLANGTVTAVEDDALWGGSVTVDHGGGVISVYRGVDPTAEVGDELTTDDFVGKLSDVPCECDLGPHLHMELYKDGKAADVTALFEKQLSYE